MKCNRCGSEVEDNSKFCRVCGQNLQDKNIDDLQINQEKDNLNKQTEQKYKQKNIDIDNNINTQKDNKSTFKIVVGVFAVIIVIAFIFTIIVSSRGTSKEVETVKNGNFIDYPEYEGYTTIGSAFENYFDDTKWRYFVSDDGLDIVEFEGVFLYCDKETNCCLQFELYDDNHFETYALEFNGVPQSNIMMNALIDEVMTDAQYMDEY